MTVRLTIAAFAAAVTTGLVTAGACGANPATVVITGARPPEQAALRGLVQQLGPSLITRIELFTTPQPGHPQLEPGTMRMRVFAGDTLEGNWLADVFIRRYVRLAATRHGLRQVAGFHPKPPKRPAAPVHLTVEPARAVAQRAGVSIVRARIVLGAGVEIVVQTPTPGAFLKGYGRALAEALFRPNEQAARFMAVEDSHGAVVWESGGLSALGFFWVSPDYNGCIPGDVVDSPMGSTQAARCGA